MGQAPFGVSEYDPAPGHKKKLVSLPRGSVGRNRTRLARGARASVQVAAHGRREERDGLHTDRNREVRPAARQG